MKNKINVTLLNENNPEKIKFILIVLDIYALEF